MSHQDYLREVLSIQCEHAYGTVQRLRDANALSDEDRTFLMKAQDVLISLRDRFRVAKNENKEANNGKDN
jgi:hypothetical protein